MTRHTAISLFRARAGSSPELGQCLHRLARISRLEAGCRTYDVHRADDDPDLWVAYEQWQSAEAVAAHMAQPHVGHFVDAIAPLIEGDVGISSFTDGSSEERLAA